MAAIKVATGPNWPRSVAIRVRAIGKDGLLIEFRLIFAHLMTDH